VTVAVRGLPGGGAIGSGGTDVKIGGVLSAGSDRGKSCHNGRKGRNK
jgi:hypothetical protein